MFSGGQTWNSGDAEWPRVMASQLAINLGIWTNVLGQWGRTLRRIPEQALVGHGQSEGKEVSLLCHELMRMKKEQDVLRGRRYLRAWMIQQCRDTLPNRLIC